VVELTAEQYVAAVLAGESSTFRSEQAMKAMAVAARTYAARFRSRHAAEGFDFCATTHCQRADPASVTDRVRHAAAETAGELLWFAGNRHFQSIHAIAVVKEKPWRLSGQRCRLGI
jgi:stage II sporulation protein D